MDGRPTVDLNPGGRGLRLLFFRVTATSVPSPVLESEPTPIYEGNFSSRPCSLFLYGKSVLLAGEPARGFRDPDGTCSLLFACSASSRLIVPTCGSRRRSGCRPRPRGVGQRSHSLRGGFPPGRRRSQRSTRTRGQTKTFRQELCVVHLNRFSLCGPVGCDGGGRRLNRKWLRSKERKRE